MKLQVLKSSITKFLIISLAMCLIFPSISYGAAVKNAPKAEHQLPILQVIPNDGASVVRPDTPIQLVLDPNAATYNRFREQFEKGFVQYTLNDQIVKGTYDTNTKTVSLAHGLLDRYSTNKVCAITKADMHSGKNASYNTTSCYTFKTGSALHEATHLSASVEQAIVSVTDGGKLYVKVTDDYGLPATDATVKVTANSPSFSAPDALLTSSSNGEVVIPLTDHVKESLTLTVTATDNVYHNSQNTQSTSASIQFIAGSPDHLTIQADSPLTAGKSEHITGIVYDQYNNRVEDTTVLTASSTAGNVSPLQATTKNGEYDLIFTAPDKVSDAIITVSAGLAANSTQIHVEADAPAEIVVTAETDTPFAGQTDNATVVVTDQYGNPVPNTSLNVTATGSATVPSTVTTDGNGRAVVELNDTKAEPVTITAVTVVSGISGTAQVIFQAAAPAKIAVTAETDKLVPGQTDNVTVVVTDQYGNPVPNTLLNVTATGSATVPSTVTTDGNGQAVFSFSDAVPEIVTISVASSNGAEGSAQIEVQNLISDLFVMWSETILDDGSIALSGTLVDIEGHICPGFAIAVDIAGGTLSGGSFTTDSNGQFSFIVQPGGIVTISVPEAGNSPQIIIMPTQTNSGSSLVDTGINLLPDQIVEISGVSLSEINGVPTSLQNFSTATGGRLRVQQSGKWTIIKIQTPCSCKPYILKILNLKANPNSLPADGQSTAIVSGQLVRYSLLAGKIVASPVIDGVVNMSVPSNNGKVTQTSVKTDSNGNFTTIYIAGTVTEVASIAATYGEAKASTDITLTSVNKCADASKMSGISVPTGTIASASSAYANYGASYAIDGCLSPWWNAGTFSGTIQLNFPAAMTINGLQLATDATPGTNEVYTVYGLANGTWVQIASAVRFVPHINGYLLDAIPVTEGSYSAIKISVNGGSSWVAINEIKLLVPQN